MYTDFKRYQWFDTQEVAPRNIGAEKQSSDLYRIVGKVLEDLFL